MKILALIPARGGSKRLPRKNIKVLGDKPLIAWSIQAALKSQVCRDVIVSTDDAETLQIAESYGACSIGLRPAYLATDTASSVDVVLHALDEYQSIKGPVDGVLLLQPTSPFRTSESITRAVSLFEEDLGLRPVVSISPAASHPAWCFKLTGSSMVPFMGWEGLNMRSQDLESAYVLNGAIYLIAPTRLAQERSFITKDVKPFIFQHQAEAIDIDTREDWTFAESLLTSLPESIMSGKG